MFGEKAQEEYDYTHTAHTSSIYCMCDEAWDVKEK